MKPILLAAATVLLALLIALGVTEAVLRVADYPAAPPIGWKWDESPHRDQPDTGTNQMGLRGQPIDYKPGDFVVVLLGDSQVEAGTSVPEQMPARMLERLLRQQYGISNARVFSIAGAGWGTDQEYTNLQEYFRHYRADLVLLWFTAVNDYWENGYLDRSTELTAGHFKPTFELDGAGVLRAHAIVPPTKLQLLLHKALARVAGVDYPNWRLQRWLRRIPPSSAERPGASPACPATVIEQKQMWTYAGNAPITVSTDEDFEHNRSHFSPWGKEPSEREKYQIRITRALLGQVAAETEAHGAQFRFFYPYRPDLDVVLSKVRCVRSILTGASAAIDAPDLLRPLDTAQLRPYRIAFSLAPDHGITVSESDIHFNDKGDLLAMQALADSLMKQGVLPGPKVVKSPRIVP